MLSSRVSTAFVRARPAARMFSQTARRLRPVPVEEQSAHTVSQRIRQAIKNIPIEIYPLVAVMSISLSFGVYSFLRPAMEDPTLRLKRSHPSDHH